jgi:hypothetical protein
MGIVSYIKNIVVFFNGIIAKKSKFTVETYIKSLQDVSPDIKIYGDMFPSTNVNVVVAVIKSDTIPSEVQKLLQPNDGIVTIVITGELATKLADEPSTKEFVLEYCMDKVVDLSTEIYNSLSDHIGFLSKKTKTITALSKFVKNILTVVDIQQLLKIYIKSQILAQVVAIEPTSALGAKIEKLKKILNKSEFDTGLELMLNVYGMKINNHLEQRFKELTGQVTVY